MITNQLKENIIQGWLLCYQILPSGQLRFSVSTHWSCLAFFWVLFILAEASLSAFSCFCTLVCAVVRKYHEMSFIYNYSHFYCSFCNQPVLFARLENTNKLWNNNRTVHVNERNQNKNKNKSRHIQVDHGFCCSVVVVSMQDGFTVWRQSQKEDFLLIIH